VRRKRKEMHEPSNQERWLLTYADLITLLLALFIVMYSMSQVDAKKFGKIAEALNGVLKGGDSILKHRAEVVDPETGHGLLQLGDLRMINKKIEQHFEKLGKQKEIQTEITERGLVVHIMESALFKQGSAHLEPRARQVMDIIYEQVKGLPNHVRIEGHTDDFPIHNEAYPSNWELSAARATSVVRYFLENYDFSPDKISALGYGEYRPSRPNNSIENRAANRRVDVVVLTMELSLKEPSSQLYEIASNEQ
jgi:chemotaxis protein MotB